MGLDATPEAGRCPRCGRAVAVGTPCGAARCVAAGTHGVPPEPAGAAGQGPELVGRVLGGCLVVRAVSGAVFEARDLALGRTVALKVLPAATAPGGERDAQLGRLHHPHVAAHLAPGTGGGLRWMEMEWVGPARRLSDHLAWRDAAGRAPGADDSRVARALLDAVAAARAEAVVHGRLAPEHVLLQRVTGETHHVRLVGFWSAGGPDGVGARWVAPEVRAGEPPNGGSDAYAAAALVGALVGRLPAVERVLCAAPAARPMALDALRSALGGADEPAASAPPDPPPRPVDALSDTMTLPAELRGAAGRPAARLRWATVGAAVGLCVGLAFGLHHTGAGRTDPPGSGAAVVPGEAPHPAPAARRPSHRPAGRGREAPEAGFGIPGRLDMVWRFVAGGAFAMGARDGEADEMPVRRVAVASFYLARTEVTVAQYAACVAGKGCTDARPPRDGPETRSPDQPVAGVTWRQADAFCTFVGGRLATEAEWEYAARGGALGRRYPWGDVPPDCTRAVFRDRRYVRGCGEEMPAAVCSRPRGESYHGICDLAGNVSEWVQDCERSYGADPGLGDGRDVTCVRRYRGGSFSDGPVAIRAARRGTLAVHWSADDVGIRCARSASSSDLR